MCLVTVVRAEPVQVYILAGQSNMVGSGYTSDLPTSPFNYQAAQWVRFSYDLYQSPGLIVHDSWETLRPSVYGASFGPEITFGKRVDDALGEVAIIKQAANGMNLSLDWAPDATEGYMMYQRTLDHVSASLALLNEQGVAYELAGVLWSQGESDASFDNAQLYEQRLTDFIASMRADLGVPDLKFYISRLSSGTQFSGRDIMRSAQANVAKADPNVLAIDTDHLTLKDDRVHLTSGGQMGLGEAFADAVLFGPPPSDFDGDGLIAENDLNLVVKHWQQSSDLGDVDLDGFVGLADLRLTVDRIAEPQPLPGTGDLDANGLVGIEDLSRILRFWDQEVVPGNPAQGDISGDGFVGINDLSIVLSQWNKSPVDDRPPDPTDEDLDLDGNGSVGLGDVDVMLQHWSYRGEADVNHPVNYVAVPGPGDFNFDGEVDTDDLRFLLEALPDDPYGLGPVDLDGDGFVGITDLSIVLANWSLSVSQADPSGDGFVGIEDLNLILSNWNAGTPPLDITVPEPAAGVSLICLLSGCLSIGRRCQHTR